MKEVIFSKKDNNFGTVDINLRIIGRDLYIKGNNNQYSQQIIKSMESKGAKIEKGKTWMKIDIFSNFKDKLIKLGEEEIDPDDITEEEIEVKLYKFYLIQFTKAGFKIK